MPPLPPNLPAISSDRLNYPSAKEAYDKCLLAEHYYEGRLKSDPGTKLALVCVRIVGYILHNAPSETGVAIILREIASCKDHAALRDLGGEYLRAWTQAFKNKNAKDRTPAPSGHESRPSFDTLADMINDTLEPAPQSHASAKRSALARDGFRCVVTRKYDQASYRDNLELRKLRVDWDATARTQCAHIFSESTNADIEHNPDKRQWAASMWAVMSRSGYENLPNDLNGAGIHRLENILTLSGDIHAMFDSLGLWFVPTDLEDWEDNKHIYKIEVASLNDVFGLPGKYPKLIFTSTRDELPLPSPEYLAIHAACCKIAHLSGASEWFGEFEDDLNKHLHKTLANDGTSADFLYNALCARALTGSVG